MAGTCGCGRDASATLRLILSSRSLRERTSFVGSAGWV
jgi:hypothetical protein